MNVRFVEEIGECEKLWEEFSPHLSIFDEWDFRFSFLEFYKYNIYFVLLEEENQNVGLLPLWYIPEKNKYFWMGDIGDGFDWQEENSFWVKDEKYLKTLIDSCPKSTVLTSLKESVCGFLGEDGRLSKANPKQILSLDGISSVEDFLMTVNKKLRQNLRRDKKRVDEVNPEIVFDHFEDFGALVKFNSDKFLDSPFKDERMVKTFNLIIENGKNGVKYKSRMISVKVDGEIVGVDLNFICGDVYYTMLCGNDTEKCPGIGHYLTMLDIEDALSLGVKLIDFAESDEGSYKEKLFKTISQFALAT
ncbi:MAG: GNAT family N-acetyltransferase [Candidatus Peregrinibacteria bacterium]|nr:GNAT family N-acetyltransferase [Candidatus Peregrinibacteria bacterium]